MPEAHPPPGSPLPWRSDAAPQAASSSASRTWLDATATRTLGTPARHSSQLTVPAAASARSCVLQLLRHVRCAVEHPYLRAREGSARRRPPRPGPEHLAMGRHRAPPPADERHPGAWCTGGHRGCPAAARRSEAQPGPRPPADSARGRLRGSGRGRGRRPRPPCPWCRDHLRRGSVQPADRDPPWRSGSRPRPTSSRPRELRWGRSPGIAPARTGRPRKSEDRGRPAWRRPLGRSMPARGRATAQGGLHLPRRHRRPARRGGDAPAPGHGTAGVASRRANMTRSVRSPEPRPAPDCRGATYVIRYCRRCVMPETKPDILFDDEGVCSACRHFDARTDDRLGCPARRARRDPRALPLSATGSNYDCIIPVSGGKDSTYQVAADARAGLNPLCVTATTDKLSDIGRRNIENLKRARRRHDRGVHQPAWCAGASTASPCARSATSRGPSTSASSPIPVRARRADQGAR